MKKVFIVAETGADIPSKYVSEYGLCIVPMHVSIDGKSLKDGAFPVSEVFDSYKRTKKLPTTSATNPDEYKEMFEKIHTENPDAQILHLCYSAITTATYQNALIASEGLDYVTHIDTKEVTGGQASIVIKMAEYLKNNPDATMDEVKKEAQYWISKSCCAFFPGDLDYLRAGGRVSNAAYLGVTLLGLKPFIEMIDGKLVCTKKYRGSMSKVCKKMLREYLAEHNLEPESIFLIRSEGLDKEIQRDAEEIAKEMGYTDVKWIDTGCVISTHCGPGAFGVGGFTRN